jgi:hypothetical protein
VLLDDPDEDGEAQLPLVVLTSPEGEWHGLPGRLAAAAAAGVRTLVMRPGLPVQQLRERLVQVRPTAIALSCTMSTSLLPATQVVALAHELGLPVVAGGRGFGTDGRRAAALGADAWVSSAGEIAGRLPGLVAGPVPPPVPREVLLAEALPDELIELACARQSDLDWVGSLGEAQLRSLFDVLRWVSQHAAVARLVDDDAVLDEPLRWLGARLRHAGAPDALLADAVQCLADLMTTDTPAVARMLADAVARLRASGAAEADGPAGPAGAAAG